MREMAMKINRFSQHLFYQATVAISESFFVQKMFFQPMRALRKIRNKQTRKSKRHIYTRKR
jgi:hypothetical protein